MKIINRREQYNVRQAIRWFKDHQFIAIPLAWLVASFVGLYAVYEVFDYFGYKFFDKIATPFVVFVCLAIIIMLVRTIAYLLSNLPPMSGSPASKYIDDNDSLIEMLKEAESHSRWVEIIKIGSALSDVLWFTSRKKLRVAIGHFVEIAATQVDDRYILAATLIEDLGNTVMGLGKPDEGIAYIKRGIQIAEKNGFPFLITRGYRNLANCYAYKNDAAKSAEHLVKAEAAAQNIPDEVERYEAFGAIEYAKCKTKEHQNDFSGAISALDKSIGYYRELSDRHPETLKRNSDRLVKIYREKGVVYLKTNSLDDAEASLHEGLRLAQSTLNYDNIVRCSVLLARIQIDRNALGSAEGMMNIAKGCIGKIDTPSILQEYNEILRRLEFEKYASG